MPKQKLSSSFRDPSGFVYSDRGKIYRQVNSYYKDEYDKLMSSGLYDELTSNGWLVKHKEVSNTGHPGAYKVIQPEKVSFISYPYEWCFSQLKDAALLTLEVQKTAMKYGMGLKDASAYNIQFHTGRPVFIDTLSFEISDKPKPWVAYRQYCQHFLAPLLLVAKKDMGLAKLLRDYIDGIPLDMAADLLRGRSRLSFGVNLHIHLHARMQRRHADTSGKQIEEKTIRQSSLVGIINSLEKTTRKIDWQPDRTEWGEYYNFTNYSDKSFHAKKKIIEKFIAKAKPKTVWDLGANNGLFSRIASDKAIRTVAFDNDPVAVEANYLHIKEKGETRIRAVLMDLTNPSPALGWAHDERQSLEQRGPAGLVMALALIHHLAISNNVPLAEVARYFSRLGKYLIIEFVPKDDSQVQKLLATRKDIFGDYNQAGFEKSFGQYYNLLEAAKVKSSKRTIYLFKAK